MTGTGYSYVIRIFATTTLTLRFSRMAAEIWHPATVTGYQQIGPTAAANTKFRTSLAEFLDTFSLVRGRHTLKFGTDLRRETLDITNPANPTGSYAFTTTGSNSTPGIGGNAMASLLLGQVNAFSIDIQNAPLQPRAHIAEFFAADD